MINCVELRMMKMNVGILERVPRPRLRRKKDQRRPLSSIDDRQVCNVEVLL